MRDVKQRKAKMVVEVQENPGKKILNNLFWGNVSKNIKIFTSYD